MSFTCMRKIFCYLWHFNVKRCKYIFTCTKINSVLQGLNFFLIFRCVEAMASWRHLGGWARRCHGECTNFSHLTTRSWLSHSVNIPCESKMVLNVEFFLFPANRVGGNTHISLSVSMYWSICSSVTIKKFPPIFCQTSFGLTWNLFDD